jgi:outer membrane protein assembly factor BamB/predicted MPP superfamily phosphohydrolase
VTFAQITDLHMSALPEPASMPQADSLIGLDAGGQIVLRPLTKPRHLRSVIDELVTTAGPLGRPSFVVATGDLTDQGTCADYALVIEALRDAPLPVHLLPGNHDHYGHNHDPRPDDEPVDSGGLGTATTTRFESHLGPRWWALTRAGLHLVALDWFSHRLGIDRDLQDQWLIADLETVAAGTPVIFLTHDQMPTAFFDRLATTAPHVEVLGSLSGHWHTSRVVRHGTQLHANTGNATFGSFDWSPAQARLVSWDGTTMSMRTVAVGADERFASTTFRSGHGEPLRPDSAVWSVRLPGAVHLAHPVLVGTDAVVTAWSDDDRAAGGLCCHEVSSGERRWEGALDAPIRSGATVFAEQGVVVAVSISGGVVAVDAATGVVRWRRQVGERLRAWVHAAPVPAGDTVVVGELRHYAALDVADGSLRWERKDLARAENFASPMQGVVQRGTLVAGFAFVDNHTFGIDVDTGTTLWQRDGNRLAAPTSDIVADPDTTDIYLTRLGGIVERMSSADGSARWRANVGATFVSGRPLVLGDQLLVTTGVGEVCSFDAASGDRRWCTALPGNRVVSMGPYRRELPAVPSGPVHHGAFVIQATGDGFVHVLDAATGAMQCSVDVGAPITVPPVSTAPGIIVATAEGSLVKIDP